MRRLAQRSGRRLPRWQSLAPYVVGAVLSVALVGWFAIEQNSPIEWENPYWFFHQQASHIGRAGLPTYFLSSEPSGANYPLFVFYAGFTFSALGYATQVVPTWPVFLASIVFAFFAGYVGIYWAVRSIGLGRLASTPLAVCAICTPYFVTNLYGRGAWAELLGVSAVYLLLGSVLRSLAESGRPQGSFVTAAGVLVASALLAGTHNISLLLGSLTIAVALLAMAPLCLDHLDRGTVLRLGRRLTLPGVLGVGLTAAWLVPNLWLGQKTAITSFSITQLTAPFDSTAIILSPVLKFPDLAALRRKIEWVQTGLYNQTCALVLMPLVLGIIGFLLGGRFSRNHDDPAERRGRMAYSLALLAALAVGLFLLMTNTGWWRDFPDIARSVQFPYRLNSYLTLAIILIAAVAIRAATQRALRSAAIGVLVVVATWYVGLALYQAASADRLKPPGSPETSREAIDHGELPPIFREGTAPPSQFRLTRFGHSLPRPPVGLIRGTDGSLFRVDGGRLTGTFATDVVWSPLISVQGGRIIGHDNAGFAVVRVEQNAGPTPRPPRVESDYPARVKAGLAISVLSLIAVILLPGCVLLRRRRRRGLQQ